MKTKTIWLSAILFGIIASASLYFILFSNAILPGPSTAEPAVAENPGIQSEATSNASTPSGAEAQPTKPAEKPVTEKLVVAQGKRAVTITVNEAQGVNGFLTPGIYVDAVAMIPPVEGAPVTEENATIFIENRKVLAVGKDSNIDTPQPIEQAQGQAQALIPPGYTTVTLEVLPIEGASLALANIKGEIALMMRAPEDKTGSAQKVINLEQVDKGVIKK